MKANEWIAHFIESLCRRSDGKVRRWDDGMPYAQWPIDRPLPPEGQECVNSGWLTEHRHPLALAYSVTQEGQEAAWTAEEEAAKERHATRDDWPAD